MIIHMDIMTGSNKATGSSVGRDSNVTCLLRKIGNTYIIKMIVNYDAVFLSCFFHPLFRWCGKSRNSLTGCIDCLHLHLQQ
jgi:hypothetical protein